MNSFIYYLQYFFRAKGITYLHSPFLYHLYSHIIQDQKFFYAFEEIEQVRNELLANTNTIEITDLGAGSRVFKNKDGKNTRTISQIAQYSALRPKEGRILFRLMEYFKPKYVLELGTSLGLGTLYLHKGNPNAQIHTIEGCPNISAFAKQSLDNFIKDDIHSLSQRENIFFHLGNIDELLPKFCQIENNKIFPQIDLAYVDANHRFEPTLRYFELILTKITPNSVLIFDDIHWSKPMHQAWEIIKKHPLITLTIDLFGIGIVFFNKNLSKEDFVLR